MTKPIVRDGGSSPRMRGTLYYCRYRGSLRGIIPAYAGNTDPNTVSGYVARDHPRVCGEHDLLVEVDGVLPGSSPRMRGTH